MPTKIFAFYKSELIATLEAAFKKYRQNLEDGHTIDQAEDDAITSILDQVENAPATTDTVNLPERA